MAKLSDETQQNIPLAVAQIVASTGAFVFDARDEAAMRELKLLAYTDKLVRVLTKAIADLESART